MPKYVIERIIPEAGKLSQRDLVAIATKSNKVLREMGPGIQWQQSYVTKDRIYCVYVAENEALIKEHGKKGEFPVTNIQEVSEIIDPATSEWQVAK